MTKLEFKTVEEKELAELRDRMVRAVDLMHKSGVFETKGGSVTLHFDADGDLRRIDRSDTLLKT